MSVSIRRAADTERFVLRFPEGKPLVSEEDPDVENYTDTASSGAGYSG